MCSSVWSQLSPVFSWKFACYLYPLQHESTLKKTFIQMRFSKNGMTLRNTKKKSEKRELAKDKWYNQMGQVGTSWSRETSGTRRRGSSDLRRTSGTREGGLQIFVGQVGQGQGSVLLNHSTCPKWDYQTVQSSVDYMGVFWFKIWILSKNNHE